MGLWVKTSAQRNPFLIHMSPCPNKAAWQALRGREREHGVAGCAQPVAGISGDRQTHFTSPSSGRRDTSYRETAPNSICLRFVL